MFQDSLNTGASSINQPTTPTLSTPGLVEDNSPVSTDTDTALIIGVSVGLSALLIIVGLVFFWRERIRRKTSSTRNMRSSQMKRPSNINGGITAVAQLQEIRAELQEMRAALPRECGECLHKAKPLQNSPLKKNFGLEREPPTRVMMHIINDDISSSLRRTSEGSRPHGR